MATERRTRLGWSLLVLLVSMLVAPEGARADAEPAVLRPVDMRCEHLVDPIAIATVRPRLSWRVESTRAGDRQSAWHVRVASSAAKLASPDLWDSGRVEGDRTLGIEYAGRALGPADRAVWSVRVWDARGRASTWSDPAAFAVGLLEPEDWAPAQWIASPRERGFEATQQVVVLPPAEYFRQGFTLGSGVERAMLHTTALGVHDVFINGTRANGDDMLNPGWTDYARRVHSRSYDVTALVARGENVVGAILADGWYAGYVGYGKIAGYGPNRSGRGFYGNVPALLMLLEVELTDGTVRRIGTDPSWRVSTGGYLEADILMGETFDARLHPTGWDRPGFDDRAWSRAIEAEAISPVEVVYRDSGGERAQTLRFEAPPRIEPHPGPAITHTQRLPALEFLPRPDGRVIVDFGQNLSGIVRLRARGSSGQRIVIRHGEMLHPDGRLMTENLRGARATDTFVLSGAGEEWYEPRFTTHGFRYVEVAGYPGELGPGDIEVIAVHSDTPLVSEFECSDPVVNAIWRNTVWTQRSNFLDIPTDCPQRDERLGWTGDAQAYAMTATYNADVASFFAKWMIDLRDAQTPEGAFTDYAPYPMQHPAEWRYGSAWMDAGVICPWTMHRAYADTRLLADHFDAMARFIEFRVRKSDGLVGRAYGNQWGDWLAPGEPTPVDYVDHCYFYLVTQLMTDIARELDRPADAERYRELGAGLRRTFLERWVDSQGRVSVPTQTAQVLAIWTGVLPESQRRPAGDRLAEMIRANGDRMQTGFLGTRAVLPALSATGHAELAVRLLQQREFPSWGFTVVNGATTMWERWDSYTTEAGFGRHNASMNSFSHYAFGAVCEWIFAELVGIAPAEPGYGVIRIAPVIPTEPPAEGVPPITWARARYESIRGPIEVAWSRDGRGIELRCQVPANTTARIELPLAADSGIDLPAGVELVDRVNGTARLHAVSGTHVIAIPDIGR